VTKTPDSIILQSWNQRKKLVTLNCCHMFLQVVTLADISNGTGFYIADNMLAGQENITFSSGYTWPNQQKLSKHDWVKWHVGLQQAILVDNLGHFQKPLGKWLQQWNKHPNQWHWLLHLEPLGLYHWQDGWQLHSLLTN